MNPDTASLADMEAYLRSFGGLWATVQRNLIHSVRTLRPEEQNLDEPTKKAVEQSRIESYESSIREFASVCKKING